MSEIDCLHPKLMMVNNVIKCLACQEWLYSGICSRCRRALDDHNLIGTEQQECPKEEPVAP